MFEMLGKMLDDFIDALICEKEGCRWIRCNGHIIRNNRVCR